MSDQVEKLPEDDYVDEVIPEATSEPAVTETDAERETRHAYHRKVRGQRPHGDHHMKHVSRKLVALAFVIGLLWSAPAQAQGDAKFMALMPSTTITTAVAATGLTATSGANGTNYLVCEAIFTYGSGGTTANAYVQTTLDGSSTWVDIMNFSFTTATLSKISSVVSTTALTAGTAPGDGALASNTIVSGLLGDMFRVKYVTTGTYGGSTTLKVTCIAKR